jgi:hypothetical protein
VRRLPLRSLQFQPVAGAHARPVETVDAFRDDALDVELGARVEEFTRLRVE